MDRRDEVILLFFVSYYLNMNFLCDYYFEKKNDTDNNFITIANEMYWNYFACRHLLIHLIGTPERYFDYELKRL